MRLGARSRSRRGLHAGWSHGEHAGRAPRPSPTRRGAGCACASASRGGPGRRAAGSAGPGRRRRAGSHSGSGHSRPRLPVLLPHRFPYTPAPANCHSGRVWRSVQNIESAKTPDGRSFTAGPGPLQPRVSHGWNCREDSPAGPSRSFPSESKIAGHYCGRFECHHACAYRT